MATAKAETAKAAKDALTAATDPHDAKAAEEAALDHATEAQDATEAAEAGSTAAATAMVAVVDPLTFVTPEVVGTRRVDVRATDAGAAQPDRPGRATNSSATAEWLVRD